MKMTMLDTIPIITAYPIPRPNIARVDAIRNPAKTPISWANLFCLKVMLFGMNMLKKP
jgi:hypothetical protein